MGFETTATRVWKRLARDERLAAARAFWSDTPAEAAGGAIAAIVQQRRLRPQVARALSEAERAAALASVLEPGEAVASALLVALHLSERRPMLAAFLDALSLPHEQGLLKEEADALPRPSDAALQSAADALKAAFPAQQVGAYLNTLWLQDPERWEGLTRVQV